MGGPATGRVPADPSSPSPMPDATPTRVRPGLGALLLLGCALGIAGVAEAAHSQQNCKKTLRTLAFERCSGYRDKRSEIPSLIEESRARKREKMSIRKIFVSPRKQIPIYDIPYDITGVRSFARHRNAPTAPSGDSDIYRAPAKFESLPKESSSELGFDVSLEEMMELFREMYERMPRSLSPSKTREESMREFMALAYECCKNQDLCLTKKELIPIHCI